MSITTTLGKDVRVEEIPDEHEGAGGGIPSGDCWRPWPSVDDALMEKFLDGRGNYRLTKSKRPFAQATIANKMVPVICGTSYRNKGVQKLLDAVIDYMPSPIDIPPIKGVNPKTDETTERKASRTRSPSRRWLSRL